MSHEIGYRVEQFVLGRLRQVGIEHTFDDDFYDVKLGNGELLEIKSCRLSVRHKWNKPDKTKGEGYRIGRFDFTSEENRDKLWEANAWLCFVVRHREQYMLCGFVRAKELPNRRTFTVHDLRRCQLLDLGEFKEKVKIK
ncbi:unnamed protein product [marine sediment metagenome]|uniref:Protein NO VEIN C-terminal domain-containing protein n=1 Tax=marine sediment metagenome TaxID=412755 RepID=X0VXV1_9ZZZZ